MNLKRQQSEIIHRKSIPENYDYFQSLVMPHAPSHEWENRILVLEDEIDNLKLTLKSRDDEISKLRREIHKLKVRQLMNTINLLRLSVGSTNIECIDITLA